MNYESIKDEYYQEGGVVVKGLFKSEYIKEIENGFLMSAREILTKDFKNWHDKDLLNLLKDNPPLEAKLYEKCREMPILEKYAFHSDITNIIKHIIGDNSSCFNKKIMRIDLPLEVKELAHWHQDYYYVKGNTEVIVVWVALHDMTWFNGCLSYMPKSHNLGIIEHDIKLGKKNIPSMIFDKEVRYLEMKKGDVLFFNTLLLHSSNMNYSENIRYSLQFRYTPSALPVDPYMLGIKTI